MARHIARKRFGQHFLRDADVLADIVRAIRPRPGDNVVEIGPGLGALTRPLLEHLPHLNAIELDRDLIAHLQQRFSPQQLTLHAADALAFDFASLGESLRIVGNLPYNISTPLLFHLAHYADRVRDIHAMLQKEVVDRMTARPGTADYGRLSVMLQYHFDMEALFDVPPEAFDPPPKVQSAVIRMIPRPPHTRPAVDVARLEQLVARAFSQRRKTLRNTLAGLCDENDFAQAGIDSRLRAETLSLDDFIRLTQRLAQGQSKEPSHESD